jgi:hypothetical protein
MRSETHFKMIATKIFYFLAALCPIFHMTAAVDTVDPITGEITSPDCDDISKYGTEVSASLHIIKYWLINHLTSGSSTMSSLNMRADHSEIYCFTRLVSPVLQEIMQGTII